MHQLAFVSLLFLTTAVSFSDAFSPRHNNNDFNAHNRRHAEQQQQQQCNSKTRYQSTSTTTTTILKQSANDNEQASATNKTASSSLSSSAEPILLQPFLPATDPNYLNTGPVGQGDFCIQRTGEPRPEELTNENILKIVLLQCTDLEVNTLVWKCLGYRFVDGQWTASHCFPKWREKYDSPPDFIGMQRVYSREVDQVSLRSNQALVRSIPADNKQSLKEHLKPLGFKGYQYKELTPNKTRRAQCANWLIYFREELFGYTIEELQERKRQKQAAEAAAASTSETPEWKPPVKEVY